MENNSGLFILKGPVKSDEAKDADVLKTSGSKDRYFSQFEAREAGATGIPPSEASIASLRGALESHAPVVVIGGHDLTASSVGFEVRTEVFASDLSDSDWNRQKPS